MKMSGKEIINEIDKINTQCMKLRDGLIFRMMCPSTAAMRIVFAVSETGEKLKITNPDILAHYMQHDRSKVFEAQLWIAERFPNNSDEKPKKKEKNAKD